MVMGFFAKKEKSPLEELVASVPNQADVYQADLAAALLDPDRSRTAEDLAIDGIAHHVFNTLRGADSAVAIKFDGDVPVEWASFADVRALVAARFV